MGDFPELPDIDSARLPAVYEAAKHALAECSRTDECQDWADKAEALASYAKQSKDQALRKMADRIQARAIRRCGELLGKVLPAKNQHAARTGNGTSRTKAAKDAGLSKRQKDTALRVAAVSQETFEQITESDEPATVTQLAELGTKPLLDLGNRRPQDFSRATQALAELRRFAEFAKVNDPAEVAAGVLPAEIAAARAHVAAVDSWLDRFVVSLGG